MVVMRAPIDANGNTIKIGALVRDLNNTRCKPVTVTSLGGVDTVWTTVRGKRYAARHYAWELEVVG